MHTLIKPPRPPRALHTQPFSSPLSLLVIVEIVVKVPQHTFNATAEGENLYKVLADAETKVETQLKKHHDKLVSHH